MAYTQIQDTRVYDSELALGAGMTAYRGLITAQSYTMWGDSIADGASSEWATTVANGATLTSTGGEGLVQTSASATGSIQIIGPVMSYLPGQVSWFNSSIRLGDTGSTGNTRRFGNYTISGGVPQDGFAYELIDTVFYATVFKGGTATRVASTAWSQIATAPFTLDVNFHGFEIRYTTNTVRFYINNVLRHTVLGTTAGLTNTLSLPISAQNVNTSGATNRILGIRNIGQGRFGEKPTFSNSSYDAPFNSTSTALEASRVVKTTSGNVYSITVNNTKSSAQWIHIYDSATLPANGVVPTLSYYITASSTLVIDFKPRFFNNGIVVANSSTQATKTIGSADCLFDVQYF